MINQKRPVKIGSITINTSLLLVILSAISFCLPFLLGRPQFLVGTIINGLIILAACNFSIKTAFPIIMFPSLGALARGVLFGPLTPFLYFFIPFIWVSNYLLFFTVKKMSNFYGIIVGGGVKAMFLYLAALVFFKLGIVPAIFLSAMGIIQFITAISGGVLVYLVFKRVNG